MAEETPTSIVDEPGHAVPTDVTPADVLPPEGTQLQANLHVMIWETPPNYLCLPCNFTDPDYATVVAHLQTAHGLAPVLTPFATDILSGQATTFGLAEEFRMSEPTYRTEETQDGTKYICLWCEQAGSGHWSFDKALFQMHMAQRHDGRMVPAAPETSTASAAPGEGDDQSGSTEASVPSPPPDQPEEGGSVPQATEEPGATEPGA